MFIQVFHRLILSNAKNRDFSVRFAKYSDFTASVGVFGMLLESKQPLFHAILCNFSYEKDCFVGLYSLEDGMSILG